MTSLHRKTHLMSAVMPALFVGVVSGALSAVAVTLFKFCAERAVSLSSLLYSLCRERLWLLLPVAFLSFAFAAFLSRLYRALPDLRGGGIPATIGTLRGLFSFPWWKTVIGTFSLSLISFLLGIPLGTEGPSVQMGCGIGSGVARLLPKRHRAWERFSMTGGASAGFSVATGAPISGILFSIEEAHQRISPLIVLVSISSVMSAQTVSVLLSEPLGVSASLFSVSHLPVLSLSQFTVPLTVGLLLGLFAVAFLLFYRAMGSFWDRLSHLPKSLPLFGMILLVLAAGVFFPEAIGTGHHLVLSFYEAVPSLGVLLLIVLLRSLLTVGANTAGLTGGVFLPLLAIAAGVGALLVPLFDPALAPLVISLGICGGIAGLMQMPLTAILFSVEALGCGENLLPVILTASIAYITPVLFGLESTNEQVLERRKKRLFASEAESGELTVLIAPASFAVGKELRDIFWPNGVFVESVHGERKSHLLGENDRLILRYTTHDKKKLLQELQAITGDQHLI